MFRVAVVVVLGDVRVCEGGVCVCVCFSAAAVCCCVSSLHSCVHCCGIDVGGGG